MGETSKQVRVDNWGIFFLQRLQLFFNKTDYCDLTLQFEGNVQLKVHRLVMNACTDYFNMLEQTCEMIDGNILVMPHDLQADVILPIVNFMYTGMLEFQMSIFDKLYNTAELMNIPVLTKLLDAQKKPIAHKAATKKQQQPNFSLHGKKIATKTENDLPATLPGRKLPVWKRKSVPSPAQHAIVPHYYSETKRAPQDPLATFDNTPKPTRFEWPEDEITSTFNLMDNSFDDITYTSKPLLTQEDELRASTSFDEMRHPPTSHKKSKEVNNQTIDMEEVKNYVKEQKIRSDLVEYDDEDDPDCYLEHVTESSGTKRKNEKAISPGSKRVRFSVNEKENKETKINVTPSGKASDMNHTKIISEVLRKYPHLVKKNKNIRLKILAKSPTKIPETQKIKTMTSKLRVQVSSPKGSPNLKLGEGPKNQDEGPWMCNKCSTQSEPVEFVLYYLYRKHMTDVHNEKFDSRMCKFCGHQSNKHNMLMYHQYTRHGIKPPPAYNFPKCNRCPYIALTENLLIKHKLNHTKFDLQCNECKVAFNSQGSLASHIQITGHTGKSGRNSYDCQYCTKRYHTGSNLFSHIKLVHRVEARRDGIVSIDESEDVEDEQADEESDEYIVPEIQDSSEKIKIISNIKVPPSRSEPEKQIVQRRESPEEAGVESEALNSEITTSLGLVDIVVLDENQQYILHNDQQLVTEQTLTNNQPEYILPEISDQHNFAQTQNITSEHNVITQGILNNSDMATTDELVMVLTDHDYNDGNSEILSNESSNIVVLYSHPVDGQQNQYITSQGNLMLNSQTGLLELRNNASSSEADVVTHDTQIESIEMIQREINSHNNAVTTESVKTVDTILTNDVDSQNTEILEEHQLSNDNENTELSEKEFTVEINGEVIGGAEEMISTTEVIDSPQVEIDDETVHITGDADDRNTHEESMEIDEERCVHDESMEIDEDCTVEKNQPVSADDEEVEEQPQYPKPANFPNENCSDVEVPNVESHADEEQIVSSELESREDSVIVTMCSVNAQNEEPIIPSDAEQKEISEDVTEEASKFVSSDPEPLTSAMEDQDENDCLEIPTDVCDTPQEPLRNAVGMEIIDDKIERTGMEEIIPGEQTDENRKEVDDDLQPPVLSPQVDIREPENLTVGDHRSCNPTILPDDLTNKYDEENVRTENPEMETLQTENTQSEMAPVLESQTSRTDDEMEKNQEPQASVEEDKTIINDDSSQNSEIQDENSQNQAISESGEGTPKGDIENENSETIDDDNSQSQDSQLSQSSQGSSKQIIPVATPGKAPYKVKPSQVTKISILDDWEDTNSQQSDASGKKAAITVNKLIHDWDDDDDDDDDDEDDDDEEDGETEDS